MDVRGQLALIRVEELREAAAAARQVHRARVAARRCRGPGHVQMAVGRKLVRAGLRLAGRASVVDLPASCRE